ncbi:MAG TPA: NYN domain-containing protein, partial [Sphingobium sp.]
TDMKMTIDAMDLMASGRVTGFGLMSSDSDFTPLVTRLRQQGIPVYGFGSDKTADAFRAACTRFIDVAALIREQRLELTSNNNEDEEDDGEDGGTEVSPELLKLLIDAYNAVKRDEQGFARLSEVGQLAGNRSSFDTRNYGFKRLSDLVRSIKNFKVETRDGQTWIKRVH